MFVRRFYQYFGDSLLIPGALSSKYILQDFPKLNYPSVWISPINPDINRRLPSNLLQPPSSFLERFPTCLTGVLPFFAYHPDDDTGIPFVEPVYYFSPLLKVNFRQALLFSTF